MFRLILFDIDGTLIRTGGAGVKAFASVFEEVFGYSTGVENIRFAGRTDISLIREMMRNHGIKECDQNFKRFIEAYPKWLDHWLTELGGQVCEGVEVFMNYCGRHSCTTKIALLTGNLHLGAKMKLTHFGIWNRFEFGAFGDDHENRNELASIAYERGRAICGNDLKPEEILVVGDTPRDIECARSIGAKVVAVTTGGATRDEMVSDRPDWLVDSMAEVEW